jgi:glycosyltransferase involved in cell wall biosynthesis
LTTAIVYGLLQLDVQEEWPSRNQLPLALSRHVPVILLERRRPGGRWPLSRIESLADNLYVVRNAFALRTSRPGRKIAAISAALDGSLFRRHLRSIGVADYVYWLTVADPLLAMGVPSRNLIFDCMDPNFLPDQQVEFDINERQVATRAALTVSSAYTLLAKMKRYNTKSFLFPNGTSRDFHPEQTSCLQKPQQLDGKTGPVVGYLGTIDWRFDSSYVLSAAEALPHCTFAIVGRVNDDQREAMAPLQRLSNVILPGQVGHDEGRSWVACFDLGIIPFKMNVMNDAINSVKMYMYLMAGLPIVSTDIAECRRNPLVRTAGSADAFTRLIRESTKNSFAPDREKRMTFALDNTWEVRAEEALALLRDNGFDSLGQ